MAGSPWLRRARDEGTLLPALSRVLARRPLSSASGWPPPPPRGTAQVQPVSEAVMGVSATIST